MENSGYQKGYADLAVLNSALTNPKKGDTYNIVLDGKLQKITLVDFVDNKNTGYQGYLYACENNKYYIVHSGSQSLNPADKPLAPGNRNEAVRRLGILAQHH